MLFEHKQKFYFLQLRRNVCQATSLVNTIKFQKNSTKKFLLLTLQANYFHIFRVIYLPKYFIFVQLSRGHSVKHRQGHKETSYRPRYQGYGYAHQQWVDLKRSLVVTFDQNFVTEKKKVSICADVCYNTIC